MKKEQGPRISFSDQLESLVCVNRKIVVEQEAEDFVRIRVALKLEGTAKFLSRFIRVRDSRKYVLSALSFTVFHRIRERPVPLIDLIAYLRDTQKLSFFEARALILQYIAMLMRRGIVAVEVPSPVPGFTEEHPTRLNDIAEMEVVEPDSPELTQDDAPSDPV